MRKSSTRTKDVCIAILVVVVTTGLFSAKTSACDPPDCPPCHSGTYPDCEYLCNEDNCQTCIGGSCTVCGGNTNQVCCDGGCCDTSINCQTCAEGECVNQCVALGKHCVANDCVECIYDFHCKGHVCEKCIGFECEHPCDNCFWPKYCSDACFCVECSLGYLDENTCNDSKDEECPGCGSCSDYTVKIYSGDSIRPSCTGDECEPEDVVCYVEYPCMKGSAKFLERCIDAVPDGRICMTDISDPIPMWCRPCEIDGENVVQTNKETTYSCPPEAWHK